MVRALLFIGYPVLAHLSILNTSHWLGCIALVWLAVALLYPRLSAGSRRAWGTFVVFAAVALLASWLGGGLALMIALSVALPALALSAFVFSLRPGQTALITRIARQIQGPLPPPLERYTRRLTIFWSVVIAALIAVELLLALSAHPQTWSSYANGYAYAILGVIFAVEYIYRRLRYRHYLQPTLRHYLRGLLAAQHPTGGWR